MLPARLAGLLAILTRLTLLAALCALLAWALIRFLIGGDLAALLTLGSALTGFSTLLTTLATLSPFSGLGAIALPAPFCASGLIAFAAITIEYLRPARSSARGDRASRMPTA